MVVDNPSQDLALETVNNAIQVESLLFIMMTQNVTCDTSTYGTGAVLSITNGTDHPVAYALITLTVAERKCSELEKEGLVITFGTNNSIINSIVDHSLLSLVHKLLSFII